MTQIGLLVLSNATTLETLAVSRSSFNDNGSLGIEIQTGGSGGVTASIDRTVLYGNSGMGLRSTVMPALGLSLSRSRIA